MRALIWIAAGVVVVATAMAWSTFPDLRRYLKIKSM
jgi:hypothetical protein